MQMLYNCSIFMIHILDNIFKVLNWDAGKSRKSTQTNVR